MVCGRCRTRYHERLSVCGFLVSGLSNVQKKKKKNGVQLKVIASGCSRERLEIFSSLFMMWKLIRGTTAGQQRAKEKSMENLSLSDVILCKLIMVIWRGRRFDGGFSCRWFLKMIRVYPSIMSRLVHDGLFGHAGACVDVMIRCMADFFSFFLFYGGGRAIILTTASPKDDYEDNNGLYSRKMGGM